MPVEPGRTSVGDVGLQLNDHSLSPGNVPNLSQAVHNRTNRSPMLGVGCPPLRVKRKYIEV